MENIRIGNSIHVSWRLYNNNGSQYALSGKIRRLWIISAALEKEITSYGIQGRNEIVFSIPADDLIRYGTYKIRLTIRESESETEDATYDLTQIFQVVSQSYPNASNAIGGVADLSFTSVLNNVVIERIEGLSAYEIAVNNGYEGTEQEWIAMYDNAVTAANNAAEEAIAATETVMANEESRQLAESARDTAEQARMVAEQSRVTAERARSDAETARSSAETARINAENARNDAESLRDTAESDRVRAEAGRVTAEASRVEAETSRQDAEQSRRQQFEGLKTDMETAIDNVDAKSAEIAEDIEGYEANEAARVSAEQSRVSAESSRVSAESARAAAETARAAQASSDHTRAETDHSTAESDHTTATGDHTQAGTDHTQAASDHTTAAADHTRAEADHTASETATQAATDAAEAATEAAETIDEKIAGKADESEVSQLRSEVTGYFYNENVSVNTNSKRIKNYTLDPGSKIVVRVSLVSGTSATINLYWIKAGGNVAILSGYPIGYMTDILTVPDDATGIQIFMTPAASGNVNKIEIWDATKAEYLTEKIGQFGLDFLNNRKMISKTVTIPANNSAMDLVSLNEGRLAGLSGDIYAYISCSPKIADDKEIQFWNTEDSASRSVGIYGIKMRQDRVFKIWDNKTFSRINVDANVVTTSTEVTIVVFAIVPSDTYLKYPLYGKKVMCFGDSITEFKTSIDNKRYTDHLQEYSQADVKNAGIGGTRLAQRLTPSLTPTDNQYCVAAFDICNMVIAWATGDYSLQDAALASGLLTSEQQSLYESKIAMLKDNPIAGFDIVTIMAGANDYRGGSPVGLENQETMDKGTIRGAINAMVSALLAAKPTLEINFFSPLILMMGGGVSLNNSSDVYIPSLAPDGMSFPAYIEKIHDAVKENHCPFNDMYWSLGFNVYNFTTFFGNDLSHPYRGFRVIAERMYKYLLQR